MILKETKTQWWGNIQGVDEKIILGLTKNRFKKKKKMFGHLIKVGQAKNFSVSLMHPKPSMSVTEKRKIKL